MGGYIQNYYKGMFMKRPWKIKISINLKVTKGSEIDKNETNIPSDPETKIKINK